MFEKKNQSNEKKQPKKIVETPQPDENQEDKSLDEIKAENEALFEQLTNKNSEYMVKLNRKLDEYGLTEEQKAGIAHQMLPVIVEQQANHLTARKIYGTVTDQARYLAQQADNTEQEGPVERSETWKIYLDGSLTLGGFFALISGVGGFFGAETGGLSLISLILNFLLAGAAMMVLTNYAPTPGQKGGFVKYLVATTGTMLVWMIVMIGGAELLNNILPSAINPVFSGTVLSAIGAVAIALKFYLKKQLNIQGTLF